MSILVTGGAGYIGGATVELLRERGKQVVVLDNLSRGHERVVPTGVPFYRGDVGDRPLVASILREHDIQSCIHFAAYANVGESVERPALYYENNLVQGVSLLRELIEGGVTRFVFSSTCATYGEPQWVPMTEDHPQRPVNPYGWSKMMVERVLESYSAAYALRFVALRYFNAAGATAELGEHHEPETHLIPNVLAAAAGKHPYVTVHGADYSTADGTANRDYVHIEDLAEAHALALDYLNGGGASDFFNIGTGQGFSVLEVIEAARRVTGRDIKVIFGPRRAGDPPSLVAAAGKVREALGWQPRYTQLEDIIASAWKWHITHPDGYR
jgi:UDP-glucose 4-epimerase